MESHRKVIGMAWHGRGRAWKDCERTIAPVPVVCVWAGGDIEAAAGLLHRQAEAAALAHAHKALGAHLHTDEIVTEIVCG